jgi:large subunit ribosomal protein L29
MAKKDKKGKSISLNLMNESELLKMYNESKKELQEIRFSIATSSYNKVSRVKHLKKNIARILTVQNERKYGINQESR